MNKARISYENGKPKLAIVVQGDYMILQDNKVVNRLVMELIRLTDTKKAEINYIVL